MLCTVSGKLLQYWCLNHWVFQDEGLNRFNTFKTASCLYIISHLLIASLLIYFYDGCFSAVLSHLRRFYPRFCSLVVEYVGGSTSMTTVPTILMQQFLVDVSPILNRTISRQSYMNIYIYIYIHIYSMYQYI